MTQATSITAYINNDTIQENIQSVLKDRAPQFIASVVSLVNSNDKLKTADKRSILGACLTAAALDLPINQNLGFAYIVPYNGVAQFQMGAKGFKQLAMRSEKYKFINEEDVREGESITRNRLTGQVTVSWLPDEERNDKKIVGYIAYFQLLTGYEKTRYMTIEQIENHAKKYSQTYKKGFGNWKDDFDAMARKTVIKLLLSKDGVLSSEMQKAIESDQSAIDENGLNYVDNKRQLPSDVADEKETKRILDHIKECTTIEDLQLCQEAVFDLDNEDVSKAYADKKTELGGKDE
jgi:recombination protein RecT